MILKRKPWRYSISWKVKKELKMKMLWISSRLVMKLYFSLNISFTQHVNLLSGNKSIHLQFLSPWIIFYIIPDFPGRSDGKASAYNVGHPGWIPGSGRCPGEGNGNPLQYSCLENPMGGGAWWAAVHGVAKSQTLLSDFTFTFHFHPLEKEMATHSSVLAWRIPGTGEPGGLPSMGLHRVGHDWSDLAAAN